MTFLTVCEAFLKQKQKRKKEKKLEKNKIGRRVKKSKEE